MRDGRCSWPGRAALSAEERRGEVELPERFERCLRGGDAGRLERHGEVERVHGDVGVGELVGVLSEDLSVDFKAGVRWYRVLDWLGQTVAPMVRLSVRRWMRCWSS